MTSTVLDVTVLLLCISAGVITLGAAGGEPPASEARYTADAAADRLATETATVEYPVSGTERDSRTVHATLVEHLSMATAAETWNDTAAADRYRTRAITAVEDAIGPRTRIDVRHRVDGVNAPTGRADVRSLPTRSATVVGPVRGGTDEHGLMAGSTRRYPEVAVGPEPPRDVTVTAAVVTQPGPDRFTDDEGVTDRLRIVVRTW